MTEDHQRQTLVLDQSYRPIDVVSWTDAVSMWFKGAVEIVSEYDEEARSTYLVIKIPAVVRIVKWFKRDDKRVKFSRVNVYARDDYRCQYCNVKCSMSELTYDHVLPRSQGGKTNWTNIVAACSACNGAKAGRTPEQAKMRLRKKPVEPRTPPAVMMRLSRESSPVQWRDFAYWTTELEHD